jgi:hypothetical protein
VSDNPIHLNLRMWRKARVVYVTDTTSSDEGRVLAAGPEGVIFKKVSGREVLIPWRRIWEIWNDTEK